MVQLYHSTYLLTCSTLNGPIRKMVGNLFGKPLFCAKLVQSCTLRVKRTVCVIRVIPLQKSKNDLKKYYYIGLHVYTWHDVTAKRHDFLQTRGLIG